MPADFIEGILDETREEISRADTKANILLAGTGVAATVLGAGLMNVPAVITDARGPHRQSIGLGLAPAVRFWEARRCRETAHSTTVTAC